MQNSVAQDETGYKGRRKEVEREGRVERIAELTMKKLSCSSCRVSSWWCGAVRCEYTASLLYNYFAVAHERGDVVKCALAGGREGRGAEGD